MADEPRNRRGRAGLSTGWIVEAPNQHEFTARAISRLLAHELTKFQEMYIVETPHLGRALVLDGKWQSCEADEFIYHEALVHPAFVVHGDVKRVLILGGAEGATAREILRWSTVTDVTMVDIDGAVVEQCKQHLPGMHRGAFTDARLTLIVDDAVHYLTDDTTGWDLIVFDVSDPIEEGPSGPLFTREFFDTARTALAAGGHIAVQCGPAMGQAFGVVIRTLREVFASVLPYVVTVPTYPGPWGLAVATNSEASIPAIHEVETRLSAIQQDLRFLDAATLAAAFTLPLHVRARIDSGADVATRASPVLFF